MESLRIAQGRLKGIACDQGVRAYKGVPYAAPPTGPLRWRAPRPHPGWDGERAADRFGMWSLQERTNGRDEAEADGMGEDCLTLNVWSPWRDGMAPLPVMVWIHGGGFIVGSGAEPWYDGARLAARGAVVVTINYRLDALGFLAHPALGAEAAGISGNYGLLDQIAALQWVQANIAAFGGDPGRVTVFGESAGSVSVSMLMASPPARGLFHRAIGQSGSAFLPAGSPHRLDDLAAGERYGVRFARELGVSSLAALRAAPAEELVAAAIAMRRPLNAEKQAICPLIGGHGLPLDPFAAADARALADIPLMMGATRDEGTMFNLDDRPSAAAWAARARERFGEAADDLLAAYSAGDDAQAKRSSDLLLGDELVHHPMWRWARAHAQAASSPVWRYLFDHRPPAPEQALPPEAGPGVFHGAEILYVFDNLAVRDWAWTDCDRRLAERLSTLWLRFARDGAPGMCGGVPWPAWDAEGGRLLRIAATAEPAPEADRDRLDCLDRLYTRQAP